MIKAVQYFNYSNALEALEFYEKNFDAVINTKIMASDPKFAAGLDEMGMSAEDAETFVMNAEFEVLGQRFMASSTWQHKDIDNSGAIITFVFDSNNEEELNAVTNLYNKAVEAGCRVDMKLGPTEWTRYFASFKDPYGINWMISGE